MTFTRRQLKALRVYRTHKCCQCQDCELARLALKEYDSEKWPGGQAAETTRVEKTLVERRQ